MGRNDTRHLAEPPEHWGTRAIAILLNPFVWVLVTAIAALIVGMVGAKLASHRSSVPQWLMVATIVASPVAYVVVLRRREASWTSVAGRVTALALSAAVLTVVASAVASNLLGAIDRGKQKWTMRAMRGIASDIDAYLASHPAGAHARSVAEVGAIIGHELPAEDGWSDPFLVRWDGSHYLLRSLGRDGRLDAGTSEWIYKPGTTIVFDDDIVLEDGRFTRYPLAPT